MLKIQKQLFMIVVILSAGSFFIGVSYADHYNIIRAVIGQISDLLNIQNSSGVDLIKVTKDGNMIFKPSQNLTGTHDVNTTRLFVGGEQINAPLIFDMKASRAFNGTYQNLSGNQIFLVISYTSNTLSNNDGVRINLHVQNITPPTQDVVIKLVQQKGGQAVASDGLMAAIIPNGYYYQVLETKNGTGSATIQTWIEYR